MLDFGTGSGRNAGALAAAGFAVIGTSDAAIERGDALPPGEFAAVVSTHALLHGTSATIAARVASLAGKLVADGLLYAVFGSVRDARFGQGTRIEAGTFAPLDGDERGVPHTYFTRSRLRALLAEHFALESLDELCVDDVAGRWAHPSQPLSGAVHWFAVARRANGRRVP